MAETIYTYALTTVQRMKDRMTITVTDHDPNLLRMINAVTDFIESQCHRRFLEGTYTDEVYSIHGHKQNHLFLKHYPVSVLTQLQYGVGTPSNKSWTSYLVDDFELADDGSNGMVRMYNILPYGVNKIRATYTAGYKIDWPNFGTATHTLPADLTDLCERLVTKLFKKRDQEGKDEEIFNGNRVIWSKELTADDKAVVAHYKRFPVFS